MGKIEIEGKRKTRQNAENKQTFGAGKIEIGRKLVKVRLFGQSQKFGGRSAILNSKCPN